MYCNTGSFVFSLWKLGIWDLPVPLKHPVSTPLVICYFMMFFAVTTPRESFQALSTLFELQYCTRIILSSSLITVMDIILRGIPRDCFQRTSTSLGAVIHPCRLQPACPLSNQTWTHPLSARQTCWMDIIVHRWGFHHCNPSTKCRHSQKKMKRPKEKVAYLPCVSLQRAQGGKSVESLAWACDSSPSPSQKRTKD